MVIAALLVPLVIVGLVSPAQARKPQRTNAAESTQIHGVQCSADGSAQGVTYEVTSSRSSVDVEVRWRVFTGQYLEFGGTYVIQRYRNQPTNRRLSAPAPGGYDVTSVQVTPIKKNGRPSGGGDSAPVNCAGG